MEGILWFGLGALAVLYGRKVIDAAYSLSKRLPSKAAHLLRSALGKDPHDWVRDEHLHGLDDAKARSADDSTLFYGSGKITPVWVCSCGASTEMEPEGCVDGS